MTSAQSGNQARKDFNDAFDRYWDSIRERVRSGEVQVFSPLNGNPRRITRMTNDEISLVETTRRRFPSKCRRVDLKNDFIKLLNNPGWRNRPLAQIRTELNIVNFLEFKRDMYELFEREYIQTAQIGISSLEYDLVTRSDLEEAIDEIGTRHTVAPFGESTVFDVLVGDERRLSPKAIVGIAAKHRLGRDLGPSSFSGGEASRSFRLLIQRGFELVTKPTRIQGLDATCSVGRRADTFLIILESRGPGRNTEYAEGFESVLYTLADLDARELHVYIASRETRMLSKAARQLAPSSGSVGIAMRAVDDVSELRRSIAGLAAAFGRDGAPGGNNTKRLRLEFRLVKPIEIRRIAEAIGEDKGAADGPIRPVNFHPSSPTQNLELQQRKAIASTDVTRVHAKMQKSLYKKLCQRYGKQNVAVELPMSSGRPADIVVRQSDGFLVFEIKTAVSPRDCVRQALGQLLEYSYWPGSSNCAGLKVVGQTTMDTRTQEYLEGLRTRFNLNVEYLHEHVEL